MNYYPGSFYYDSEQHTILTPLSPTPILFNDKEYIVCHHVVAPSPLLERLSPNGRERAYFFFTDENQERIRDFIRTQQLHPHTFHSVTSSLFRQILDGESRFKPSLFYAQTKYLSPIRSEQQARKLMQSIDINYGGKKSAIELYHYFNENIPLFNHIPTSSPL